MKKCGGCQHFTKWKKDSEGGGLCNLYDYRTKTDYGKNCKGWKAIPYKRSKINHKEILIEADYDFPPIQESTEDLGGEFGGAGSSGDWSDDVGDIINSIGEGLSNVGEVLGDIAGGLGE
jgi:hypothetical protein